MENIQTTVASWFEHNIFTTYINMLTIAHKRVYYYNQPVAP